jgi:hypothetical protein
MPFYRLRGIPKVAKEAAKRATPNNMLMKHLLSEKVDLTFPLNKQFVEKIMHPEKNIKTNASGFEMPLGGTEKLPFAVDRTNSGSLPVYMDYRAGRTRTETIVRKITGDVKAIASELVKITGSTVVQKPAQVVVKGHHLRIIRLWLRSLGF